MRGEALSSTCNHCIKMIESGEPFTRIGNQIFHENCFAKHAPDEAYAMEVKVLREVKIGK